MSASVSYRCLRRRSFLKCLLIIVVLALFFPFDLGLAARVDSSAGGNAHAHVELFSWGRNNAGQLGVVDEKDRTNPTLVEVLKPKTFAWIASGGSDQVDGHSVLLTDGGKMYTTGDNSYGQLGFGDVRDRDAPSPLASLFGHEFTRAATGESHTVALDKDGRVFVWGGGIRRQLGGDAAQAQMPEPRELDVTAGSGERVVGICAGHWFNLAWTNRGSVHAWGDNSFGELGTGDKRQHDGVVTVDLPTGGNAVKDAVCGGHHALVVMQDGGVYAWGKNVMGQLGNGAASNESVTSPILLDTLPDLEDGEKVVRAFAGFGHSALLTARGKLYVAGDNAQGQLGIGAGLPHSAKFSKPTALEGIRVMDAALGRAHTMIVMVNGDMFAFGGNTHGQLGTGDTSGRPTPHRVNPGIAKDGGNLRAKRVFAGPYTTFVAVEGGDLLAWGRNNAGQLGSRASKAPKLSPTSVGGAGAATSIASIAAGGFAYQYEGHSALVSGDGEMFTWGANAWGQCGTGESGDGHGIPARNPWVGKHKIVRVAAGQFSTAAITDAGEVYVFGLNDSGQLGKGDFSPGMVEVPQRVHIDGEVVGVSIGYAHMLAWTSDGKLLSWGRNFYGQLGVGDHRDKSSPQVVSYLQEEKVVSAAAGQFHSVVVTERGELYGFGYNRDYELGVGDNMDRVLPQVVPTLSGKKVVAVAAGGYHTLAVTEDGSLYTWGLNNLHQLGRAEKSSGKVPSLVPLTSGGIVGGRQIGKRLKATQVAAGTWHSLAVTQDGSLFAWGRCEHGALGVPCDGGENGAMSQPHRVESLKDKKVLMVAAGAAHSHAVVAA